MVVILNWKELLTPSRVERPQKITDMGITDQMKISKSRFWMLHLGQGSPGYVGNERRRAVLWEGLTES